MGKLTAGAVTFLACLLAAQMTVQVAALGLVPEDVLVDPFVVDREMTLCCQPETDLLWAPILKKQSFDQAPVPS